MLLPSVVVRGCAMSHDLSSRLLPPGILIVEHRETKNVVVEKICSTEAHNLSVPGVLGDRRCCFFYLSLSR